MTPTEKQKIALAGWMLGLVLLAGALLSGEVGRGPGGWHLRFRDLQGAIRVSLEQRPSGWPRLSCLSSAGQTVWQSRR